MDTYFQMHDLVRITGEREPALKLALAELGLQAQRSFTSDDVVLLRRQLLQARGGRRGGGGRKPYTPGIARAETRRGVLGGVEYRIGPAASAVRLADDEDEAAPTRMTGYAVLWGALSQDLGGFVECFAPAAFSESLRAGDDVCCRYNHDALLARTGSGTLRLAQNSAGLRYDFDIPDTTVGRDLTEMVTRGDVAGSSFCFQMQSPDDEVWSKTADGTPLRTIKQARLIDVSPVDSPAYLDTVGKLGLRDTPPAADWKNAARLRRLRIEMAENNIPEHDAGTPHLWRAKLRLAELSDP